MNKTVEFARTATPRSAFWAVLLCAFVPATRGLAAHRLLSRHVPSLVAASTVLGAVAPDTPLNLAVGLPLRDPAGLNTLLHALYDPQNPLYRHFLNPQAFADRFGAAGSDVGALASFFKAHGLTVTRVYSNRLLLDVAGTAAQVNQVFHTHVRRYRAPTGREFYAPDAEPSLDSAVPVLHVSGLDNLAVPRHGGIFKKTALRPFKRGPQQAGAEPLPSEGSGSGGLYAGYDFRDVYLPCATLTGSGQTLALFEVDAFYQVDINNYVKDTGIPAPTLDIVKLDNFRGRVESVEDETEVALDIEMAASMAPGLSEIIVYEDNPNEFNPDNVLGDIASPPAGTPLSNQASSSWTWTGSAGDPNIPTLFAEMAAQGQSYFQAAGDLGAYVAGDPATTPPDPLIDTADMTAVGGTALTTTGPANGTAGTYVSETTWNNPADKTSNGVNGNAVSGGGVCTGLAIPSYQSPFINGQNQGSSEYRNIPDVSMVADNIFLCAGDGKTYLAGGTSAATPLWAGLLALVNQQDSPVTVGLANPLLYGAATGASAYAADFNDVNDNSTNNYANGPSSGLYPAVTGYDLATGLGSPRCGLFTAIPQLTLSPTPFETPTPSFTRSPTFSPSPTFSRSPTRTSTQSPTFTRTETATRTLTATLSATRTPSPSASPTQAPSGTAIPTATGTPTAAPTGTPTATMSATPTATPSGTITPSWTASPAVTSTPTGTDTPTASVTQTFSLSPTQSLTLSASPTASVTPTGTATPSPTPTPSPTGTPKPPATATATPLTGWLGCPACPASVLAVPNPADSQITVFVRGAGDAPLKLELYDLTGGLALSRHLGTPEQGALSVPVNLASLAQGIYVLAVRNTQDRHLVGLFKLAVIH